MTAALAIPYCRSCDDLRRHPEELPARCGDCRAELRAAPVAVAPAWRPSRGVPGMLRDLAALRAHRLLPGGPKSSMGGILDAARLGAVGDGCSGTKGSATQREDPEPRSVREHPAEAHLRSREGDHRRVWTLFLDGLVALHVSTGAVERIGTTDVTLTTEAAVGWRLATPAARAAVALKVATRDRRPALALLERDGAARLESAAKEWGR